MSQHHPAMHPYHSNNTPQQHQALPQEPQFHQQPHPPPPQPVPFHSYQTVIQPSPGNYYQNQNGPPGSVQPFGYPPPQSSQPSSSLYDYQHASRPPPQPSYHPSPQPPLHYATNHPPPTYPVQSHQQPHHHQPHHQPQIYPRTYPSSNQQQPPHHPTYHQQFQYNPPPPHSSSTTGFSHYPHPHLHPQNNSPSITTTTHHLPFALDPNNNRVSIIQKKIEEVIDLSDDDDVQPTSSVVQSSSSLTPSSNNSGQINFHHKSAQKTIYEQQPTITNHPTSDSCSKPSSSSSDDEKTKEESTQIKRQDQIGLKSLPASLYADAELDDEEDIIIQEEEETEGAETDNQKQFQAPVETMEKLVTETSANIRSKQYRLSEPAIIKSASSKLLNHDQDDRSKAKSHSVNVEKAHSVNETVLPKITEKSSFGSPSATVKHHDHQSVLGENLRKPIKRAIKPISILKLYSSADRRRDHSGKLSESIKKRVKFLDADEYINDNDEDKNISTETSNKYPEFSINSNQNQKVDESFPTNPKQPLTSSSHRTLDSDNDYKSSTTTPTTISDELRPPGASEEVDPAPGPPPPDSPEIIIFDDDELLDSSSDSIDGDMSGKKKEFVGDEAVDPMKNPTRNIDSKPSSTKEKSEVPPNEIILKAIQSVLRDDETPGNPNLSANTKLKSVSQTETAVKPPKSTNDDESKQNLGAASTNKVSEVLLGASKFPADSKATEEYRRRPPMQLKSRKFFPEKDNKSETPSVMKPISLNRYRHARSVSDRFKVPLKSSFSDEGGTSLTAKESYSESPEKKNPTNNSEKESIWKKKEKTQGKQNNSKEQPSDDSAVPTFFPKSKHKTLNVETEVKKSFEGSSTSAKLMINDQFPLPKKEPKKIIAVKPLRRTSPRRDSMSIGTSEKEDAADVPSFFKKLSVSSSQTEIPKPVSTEAESFSTTSRKSVNLVPSPPPIIKPESSATSTIFLTNSAVPSPVVSLQKTPEKVGGKRKLLTDSPPLYFSPSKKSSRSTAADKQVGDDDSDDEFALPADGHLPPPCMNSTMIDEPHPHPPNHFPIPLPPFSSIRHPPSTKPYQTPLLPKHPTHNTRQLDESPNILRQQQDNKESKLPSPKKSASKQFQENQPTKKGVPETTESSLSTSSVRPGNEKNEFAMPVIMPPKKLSAKKWRGGEGKEIKKEPMDVDDDNNVSSILKDFDVCLSAGKLIKDNKQVKSIDSVPPINIPPNKPTIDSIENDTKHKSVEKVQVEGGLKNNKENCNPAVDKEEEEEEETKRDRTGKVVAEMPDEEPEKKGSGEQKIQNVVVSMINKELADDNRKGEEESDDSTSNEEKDGDDSDSSDEDQEGEEMSTDSSENESGENESTNPKEQLTTKDDPSKCQLCPKDSQNENIYHSWTERYEHSSKHEKDSENASKMNPSQLFSVCFPQGNTFTKSKKETSNDHAKGGKPGEKENVESSNKASIRDFVNDLNTGKGAATNILAKLREESTKADDNTDSQSPSPRPQEVSPAFAKSLGMLMKPKKKPKKDDPDVKIFRMHLNYQVTKEVRQAEFDKRYGSLYPTRRQNDPESDFRSRYKPSILKAQSNDHPNTAVSKAAVSTEKRLTLGNQMDKLFLLSNSTTVSESSKIAYLKQLYRLKFDHVLNVFSRSSSPGPKHFVCSYPGCAARKQPLGAEPDRKPALQRHLNCHLRSKHFLCLQCNIRTNSRREHLRAVHKFTDNIPPHFLTNGVMFKSSEEIFLRDIIKTINLSFPFTEIGRERSKTTPASTVHPMTSINQAKSNLSSLEIPSSTNTKQQPSNLQNIEKKELIDGSRKRSVGSCQETVENGMELDTTKKRSKAEIDHAGGRVEEVRVDGFPSAAPASSIMDKAAAREDDCSRKNRSVLEPSYSLIVRPSSDSQNTSSTVVEQSLTQPARPIANDLLGNICSVVEIMDRLLRQIAEEKKESETKKETKQASSLTYIPNDIVRPEHGLNKVSPLLPVSDVQKKLHVVQTAVQIEHYQSDDEISVSQNFVKLSEPHEPTIASLNPLKTESFQQRSTPPLTTSATQPKPNPKVGAQMVNLYYDQSKSTLDAAETPTSMTTTTTTTKDSNGSSGSWYNQYLKGISVSDEKNKTQLDAYLGRAATNSNNKDRSNSYSQQPGVTPDLVYRGRWGAKRTFLLRPDAIKLSTTSSGSVTTIIQPSSATNVWRENNTLPRPAQNQQHLSTLSSQNNYETNNNRIRDNNTNQMSYNNNQPPLQSMPGILSYTNNNNNNNSNNINLNGSGGSATSGRNSRQDRSWGPPEDNGDGRRMVTGTVSDSTSSLSNNNNNIAAGNNNNSNDHNGSGMWIERVDQLSSSHTPNNTNSNIHNNMYENRNNITNNNNVVYQTELYKTTGGVSIISTSSKPPLPTSYQQQSSYNQQHSTSQIPYSNFVNITNKNINQHSSLPHYSNNGNHNAYNNIHINANNNQLQHQQQQLQYNRAVGDAVLKELGGSGGGAGGGGYQLPQLMSTTNQNIHNDFNHPPSQQQSVWKPPRSFPSSSSSSSVRLLTPVAIASVNNSAASVNSAPPSYQQTFLPSNQSQTVSSPQQQRQPNVRCVVCKRYFRSEQEADMHYCNQRLRQAQKFGVNIILPQSNNPSNYNFYK